MTPAKLLQAKVFEIDDKIKKLKIDQEFYANQLDQAERGLRKLEKEKATYLAAIESLGGVEDDDE